MTPDGQDESTLLRAAAARARILLAALERDGATLAADPTWQDGTTPYARAAEAARRLAAEIERFPSLQPGTAEVQQPESPHQ